MNPPHQVMGPGPSIQKRAGTFHIVGKNTSFNHFGAKGIVLPQGTKYYWNMAQRWSRSPEKNMVTWSGHQRSSRVYITTGGFFEGGYSRVGLECFLRS
jgi:hypothetical protein